MAQTFNEELLDAMIRHQTGMLRFSAGLRNRIWEILDAVEGDLAAQIIRRSKRAGLTGTARQKALASLLEGLRKTRIGAWSEAKELWFEELSAYAVAEPEFLERTLTDIFPVELGIILPPADQLRAIVTSTPFMGDTLKGWADKLETSDLDRIEQQIKIGLAQGETGQQIARRVVGTARLRGRDGVTQITRNHAASITRTVANGIAAEGRRDFAEANKHLAPRELFVATLDSGTTFICRSFDGELFEVGIGPVLPLHWGERSLRVLVLDDKVVGDRPYRSHTTRMLLREFSEREGFPKVTKRDMLPHGTKGAFDTFARRRIRELTGRVPAKVSYGPWLKRQSVEFQNDALGLTRARLFRSGGLTLDNYVDFDGRTLTLAELADRHAGAFRSAGLDPDSFK